MRKPIQNSKSVLATLVLTCSLSLVACSSSGSGVPGSTNMSSYAPSATSTPTSSPTPTIVYVTAPLTGAQFIDGTNRYLKGPVVMGKIDNSFAARPQSGLSLTDVVYEEMVEGGMTRFLAIWHSHMAKQFGPIRSVRPMDPDLATAYGGVISYSGGQKPFVNAMKATGIYNATETSEATRGTMKRVNSRIAPHNLFVLAQKLARKEYKLKPPKPQLHFAPLTEPSAASPNPSTTATAQPTSSPDSTATASSTGSAIATTAPNANSALVGKKVRKINAKFPQTSVQWSWSKKTDSWLRSSDGKKTTDSANHRRVSAKNLFILSVKIDRSFKDPRYGNVPKTVFTGKGKGMYFSEGHGIKITWYKKNLKSAAVFRDKKGNLLNVAVGNTWFEMVPSDVGSYNYK